MTRLARTVSHIGAKRAIDAQLRSLVANVTAAVVSITWAALMRLESHLVALPRIQANTREEPRLGQPRCSARPLNCP